MFINRRATTFRDGLGMYLVCSAAREALADEGQVIEIGVTVVDLFDPAGILDESVFQIGSITAASNPSGRPRTP
jgi:hypothetical protein